MYSNQSFLFILVSSFLILLFVTSCDSSNVVSDEGDEKEEESRFPGWLIPRGDVMDGGPGKDGIPSIDDPRFKQASKYDNIEADDRVVGIAVDGRVRAYPHYILDHHEIANDVINDFHFAVTYCPLTATASVWNRTINDTVTTFGVSGLLYKNNLIPYDRRTDSHWSQMMRMSVEGEHAGKNACTVNMVETNWKTWQEAYPNSMVMTRETGYERDYDKYPYGNYKNDHDSFLFPVINKDDRLPAKMRVHMIEVDSSHIVYPIEFFSGEGMKVKNTTFKGKPIVVVGNYGRGMVESYSRRLPDGTVLEFTPVEDQLPIVMKDEKGNQWDLFGRAVEGSQKGLQLKSTNGYNGFWFAIADFFPETEIRMP